MKNLYIIVVIVSVIAVVGIWKWKSIEMIWPVEQDKSHQTEINYSDNKTSSFKGLIKGAYTFEINDTSDWQIYSNNKYRFAFKYPRDWEIQKDSSDEGENYLLIAFNQHKAKDVLEGLKEGTIIIYVSTDTTKEPVDIELERLIKSHNISIWKANISGVDGYYYSGFGEGLLIQQHNYYLSVTTSYVPNGTEHDKQILNVLNGMVQTLCFMN